MTDTIIFSDGASRGNPGKGGWGAIIKTGDSVKEVGGFEDETTNNRMEMRALLEALRSIADYQGKVTVNTDSSYLINGMTQWVKNWKINNWQTRQNTEVLNRDLWEELDRLSVGKILSFNHIEGHVGIPANERADKIATMFADGDDADLYNGPSEDYKVNLDVKIANGEAKQKKDRSKMKAYSYLSLVEGIPMRHETWAECEARVKGYPNVKFRKSVDQADEKAILDEWGVSF